MKLLVLLSAWAPDESENSRRWIEWYRQVLTDIYGADDKIVVLNHGTHPLAAEIWGRLPKTIGLHTVPEALHINSDASGYQVALDAARDRIGQYDAVMFVHTKGMSHRFGDYDFLRPLMRETIFNRAEVLARIAAGRRPTLACFRGHMADSFGSIRACRAFAREAGINSPVFNFGATLTLYAVDARTLATFLDRVPAHYLRRNLAELRQNRFFFEGIVPSMLVMLGARPLFMEPPAFAESLNDNVSYNDNPPHNSALVAREWFRREEQGVYYEPIPIPYVFATSSGNPHVSFAL